MNAVVYLKGYVTREMGSNTWSESVRNLLLFMVCMTEESSWPTFSSCHLGYASYSVGLNLVISARVVNGHQLM